MENRLDYSNIAVEHYKAFPGKPTIVFLHDSFGCIQLWKDFPKKLGEQVKCNITIYDRFGYGKSAPFIRPKRDNYYMEYEADMLNDLLDLWGISKAILFGHSDGGTISLIAAAKYPEKVLGVITEGAHIFVEKVTLNGIREAVEAYKTSNLKERLEVYHGDKTEALFWAWAEIWNSEGYSNWSIENMMPLVKCSSLIIQGEHDEFGTIKQVDSIVNGTTGKSIKWIIPNVKHNPHKEVPDLVLNRVAEFIEQL